MLNSKIFKINRIAPNYLSTSKSMIGQVMLGRLGCMDISLTQCPAANIKL
jgi:hypothetical protein